MDDPSGLPYYKWTEDSLQWMTLLGFHTYIPAPGAFNLNSLITLSSINNDMWVECYFYITCGYSNLLHWLKGREWLHIMSSLVGLSVLLSLLPLWAAVQEDQEPAQDVYSIGLYQYMYINTIGWMLYLHMYLQRIVERCSYNYTEGDIENDTVL